MDDPRAKPGAVILLSLVTSGSAAQAVQIYYTAPVKM